MADGVERFTIVGFYIGVRGNGGRNEGEAAVDVKLGFDGLQLTERTIAENNKGNDYVYVLTLNGRGQIILRADRVEKRKAQHPPVNVHDVVTLVAFSLASSETVIFQTQRSSDGGAQAANALEVTKEWLELNRDTDLQFVCTLGPRGEVLYTFENLPSER